jgi:chromatin assembly factor 1 subunit A
MDQMPLVEMSPNIQESENGSRKRSHDEFANAVRDLGEHKGVKEEPKLFIQPLSELGESGRAYLRMASFPSYLPHTNEQPAPLPSQHRIESSPQGSPSLTDAASSTPANNSPDPKTPSKISKPDLTNKSAAAAPDSQAMNSQPAKRKKLTPAEREARDKEAAEKKKEKEQEKERLAQEREAKKQKKAEEDQAKAQEREEKKRKRAEEEQAKAQEKEEKKRKIQEEKDKEERKQPKLKSFFGAPTTPKKVKVEEQTWKSPRKGSPMAQCATTESAYTKLFKPFFLKEHTRLAEPATRMDEETREAKSAILDQFISGARTTEVETGKFNFVEAFAFPSKPRQRGTLHYPVKGIMEEVYKDADGSGASAEHANQIIANARNKLARVPIKVIAFSQDVRPPYYGTVTWKPFDAGRDRMRKLARRSMARRLPLEYDYDSEAEWQEDEEGEDLDLDDDEEEVDDEDDMDGFLDDSEDAGPARGLVVSGMEPKCSGMCFEDEHRRAPNLDTLELKMEIMLGMFSYGKRYACRQTNNSIGQDERPSSIDPWSCVYWAPEPKKLEPKKQATETNATMLPPPAPANAFAALGGATATAPASVKLVKADILNDVKKAILDNKALSKVGIVDFVFQQFRDSASKMEVKNTIEHVAERVKGSGKTKEWGLKSGHEITC